MEQIVTVELFGQRYTFSVDSDSVEAQRVADYLVEEVKKVEAEQTGKKADITKRTILILAALNIAHENYELKSNHQDLLESISKRSAKTVRLLDAGFS